MKLAGAVITVLLAVILLSQDLVDLELALDLGSWHANAPVVDLAALVLLPMALWGWWRRPSPLPMPRAYALFLVASVLGLALALQPAEALHHLVRKPLFLYLAYGVGLSWVVARAVPRRHTLVLLLAWAASTAALSLVTSVGRIAAGNTLWFSAIGGITNNHKTLAVALAGALPLVMGLATDSSADRPLRKAAKVAAGLVLVAVALSASKTAWITSVVALALFWPRTRPLGLRARLVLPSLALAFALAYYAPVLVGSKTMLDAARSRHSLNARSWMLFKEHPLVGSGSGMSVVAEMVTFPHYRVNGTGVALRRRWSGRPSGLDYGTVGTWGTLHLNLVLSTETFSPTHWVPLALAWGLAHATPGEDDRCAS